MSAFEFVLAVIGAVTVGSFSLVGLWLLHRDHLRPRLELAQLRRDVAFHNRLAARERTFPL